MKIVHSSPKYAVLVAGKLCRCFGVCIIAFIGHASEYGCQMIEIGLQWYTGDFWYTLTICPQHVDSIVNRKHVYCVRKGGGVWISYSLCEN